MAVFATPSLSEDGGGRGEEGGGHGLGALLQLAQVLARAGQLLADGAEERVALPEGVLEQGDLALEAVHLGAQGARLVLGREEEQQQGESAHRGPT